MLPLCFTRMCGRSQGVHKQFYILSFLNVLHKLCWINFDDKICLQYLYLGLF